MAFPTTGILDTFDRADATTLGASWSLLKAHFGTPGDYGISNNTCYNPDYGAYYSMYYNVAQYNANSEVYITLSTTLPDGTNDQYAIELYARVQNPGASYNGYALNIDTRGAVESWGIYRVDNGAATLLGATFSQEINDGDSIGMEIIGSTIKAYYKPSGGSWSELASRTDSTYSSGGYLGIYGTATNLSWRFNDFGGGSIPAGGTATPVFMHHYKMMAGNN